MTQKRRGTPHSVNCECPQCHTLAKQRSRVRTRVVQRLTAVNWELLFSKLISGLLIAIVIFLAGAAVGHKIGLDDGYGWQASSSIGFHIKPNVSTFPEMVYWTGNQTIGGYTFVLGTDQHPVLSGTTTGYAPPGGPIYIESNRRLIDIYETCVHERLHRTHPLAPHRWIYDVQDRVVDETCLKLIHRLG